MKLGIEVELWVVNEQGRLCDGADLTDAHERIKPEFIGPLVEIQTDPHEREVALRRDLQETLRAAIAAADEAGKRLVPLGTPLTPAAPSATDERGALFEAIYGDGIESAKNCAGTHVHFEQEAVLRQANLLTALDPAIALVSSSPYYLGEREMDCSRADAYRGKRGEPFEEYCGLWGYASSVPEWHARVDAAFETFQSLATDRGVDSETVKTHFTAENTVLNPVRIRTSLPTVEWRAPDATLPSQVVRLAVDVRDLLAQTTDKPLVYDGGDVGVSDDAISVPEEAELRELSDEAIRWGLGSERIRAYLAALGFDLADYRPISSQLCGPRTLRDDEARKIRLAYAEQLREDVETLTAPSFVLGGQRSERYLFA